ncbi:retrovirus-related pol polyprotein from transposon TNT 1-94 [Tanacetum coccineum]
MSNTNLQTQTSNALHNAIMENWSVKGNGSQMLAHCISFSRIQNQRDHRHQITNHETHHYLSPEFYHTSSKGIRRRSVLKVVLKQTIEGYMENYKNVSQDIRDQLNAEAEAVQIILTGIDNDILLTVDACPNACENFGKLTSRDGESLESYYSRNREKAIVNSSAPIYDQEHITVTEDDEMSKEKEIDKLMALISLSINRGTRYDNQRVVNVAGARENVGTQVVKKSRIQCYNCKEYGHVSRECQKPKRVKDAAYHKENILLCKQEEVGVQLNAEQADWKDDTDDESDNQELEAHYMTKDDTGELDQERDLLASLIEKLKCEIDDSKNRNKFLETSNKALVDKLKGKIEDFKTKNKSLESLNNHFKEANNELSKTNQLMFKDLKKFQAKLNRYHDVNYASKVAIDYAKAKGDLMSYKM